jgi:serum/glucocorticoid-regulated kinase 2
MKVISKQRIRGA